MKRKSRSLFWLLFLIACIVAFVWLGRRPGPEDKKVRRVVAYAAAAAGDPDVVPLTLLVDFRDDADPEALATLERRTGLVFELDRFAPGERIYRARARSEAELARALAALRRSALVEAAEREVVYGIPPVPSGAPADRADETPAGPFPNDPQYKYQWHLRQVKMPKAWPVSQGKGVIVAVIDTGVKRVTDLKQTEVLKGWNFIARNDHAEDDHGHGTHVAGTIAQSTNNGIGVAGVAYRAKILPLKVLSARGTGSVGDIADAVRYAADHGAKVINLSLGGRFPSKVLAKAVKYAHDKGVTVVCAAGNDGRGRVGYPAAYPGAIAVAATQYDETTTFYSNWGPEIDVAAPGGNVRVDQNGDGKPDGVLQNTLVPTDHSKDDYFFYMGTSMAAPHVAGVAALVVASGVTAPDAVERVLKESAHNPLHHRWDEHYGAGIVDAGAALERTRLRYGGFQLALALMLGTLVYLRVRERGLGIPVGPGLAAGLVLGSSGLFFLPFVGLGGVPVVGALAQGFPAWDAELLGPAGHANPLFYSMLAPTLLVGLLYGVRRLRGLLAGFALGVGAHLLFYLCWSQADVRWIPNVMYLDQLWLIINGLGALALGYIVARK